MKDTRSTIQKWAARESVAQPKTKEPYVHPETEKNIPEFTHKKETEQEKVSKKLNWPNLSAKFLLGLSLLFMAGALRLSCSEDPSALLSSVTESLSSGSGVLFVEERGYPEAQREALEALAAWERVA